jgi:hypothetical protein
VQPNVSNRYTWYGRPGAVLERYNVFATVNGLWRYDDFFAARSVLEDRVSLSNSFTLRGGWSISVNPLLASYAFDPTGYASLRTGSPGALAAFVPSDRLGTTTSGFGVTTPQFRRFAASVGATVGNDVDFAETARVRRRDYNASLDLRPNERLRVSATYVSSSFVRRSDGEHTLATRIPRLKAEYQISRPIFVRVVSQYQSNRREPLRDPRTGQILLVPGATAGTFVPYAASVSNGLRTDWLFSYRPTPGTVFFAGYGNTLTEPDALAFRDLRRTTDAFFVKLSYLYRMQRSE